MTSLERYTVSNHRQLNCLFNNLWLTGNIGIPHYWLFMMGIHSWSMDSPHKWQVARKASPCHDVIVGTVADRWCWHQGSFLYAPCQWETTLHCNVVSHLLGVYTKWQLWHRPISAQFGRIIVSCCCNCRGDLRPVSKLLSGHHWPMTISYS